MTLKEIALCNLRRRKAKASFVLLGLVVGVSAVVAFTSLVEALTEDINHKLEMYGANILILPKAETLSLTFGDISLGGVSFENQTIRQEELARIRSIKNARNVAALGPVVLGAVKTGERKVVLAGMDFTLSHFLRPWWKLQGEMPEGPDLLIGSSAARALGLEVGSRVEVNGRELVVSGVLDPTGSQDDQILFTSLPEAQAILGKAGMISMAEVAALCAGCPIEDMVGQISEVLPGANVMAIKQVVKGRMETLGHVRKFAYGLSAVIMLVGGLVVLVTMMGSVRERIAEIGVFRAIGFRRSHVMRIILIEAGIVSALAGTLGYLAGIGAAKTAAPLFTQGHPVAVGLDPVMAGGAILLAIVLGLVSSLYPALMAARMDPNEALRAL